MSVEKVNAGIVLFGATVNTIHQLAPAAVIAFNSRPDDSADAAARSLALGSPTT